MVKVIYIGGVGRSGSTVLATVLGNHPEVESVGELKHVSRAFNSYNEYCACGTLSRECSFWRGVNDQWSQLSGFSFADPEWLQLQQRFERTRHFPRLYFQKLFRTPSFERYARGMGALYRAIQAVSGKSIIVDSSKNPVRALALSQVEDVDLRLVHLIRDGRGVIWSHLKPYQEDPKKGVQQSLAPKSAGKTALHWNVVNRLTAYVAGQVPASKVLRLRYEDFVAMPRCSLEEIGSISSLDFSQQASNLEEGGDFEAGHTIAGNRVRMVGSIRLYPDQEWMQALKSYQIRTFWIVAGRLATQYGYSPR